jgi:hypothetical protein
MEGVYEGEHISFQALQVRVVEGLDGGFLDSAVHPLGLPVRPWVERLGQLVLNAVFIAHLAKDVELLRQLQLRKKNGVALPNVSQLSVTTGLNRKEVSPRVRVSVNDALPLVESTAAARVVTYWMQMVDTQPGLKTLQVMGASPSFELYARALSPRGMFTTARCGTNWSGSACSQSPNARPISR